MYFIVTMFRTVMHVKFTYVFVLDRNLEIVIL